MRMTSSVRSLSAGFFAVAALMACSSSKNGPSPTFDGASPTPDGAAGTTYWMAPRTSEIDLQLVTTQPTQGF